MNLESLPHTAALTIQVECDEQFKGRTCANRWQIYYRLCELDIPCQCQAYQPLTVQINSAIAAIQLWSIINRASTSRLEQVDRLEHCWRLRSI